MRIFNLQPSEGFRVEFSKNEVYYNAHEDLFI